MIESDVWNPVSTSPGIGGITGRPPAATRICGAEISRPSTSSTLSATKRAVPSIRVTFGEPDRRYSRPPAAIGSIRPNTRSRIAGQSAPWNRTSMPSRPLCPASTARSAGSTNIFDGMHPRLRQVPPNTSRSTIAIFQSASDSGIEFPEPLPTMIRSNRSASARQRPRAQ